MSINDLGLLPDANLILSESSLVLTDIHPCSALPPEPPAVKGQRVHKSFTQSESSK